MPAVAGRRGSVAYDEPRILDGYDAAALRCCLATRGVLIAADEIVGVSANGARVDLSDDRGIWVLPRWIEGARRG